MKVFYSGTFDSFLNAVFLLYKQSFNGEIKQKTEHPFNPNNSSKVRNLIIKHSGSAVFLDFQKAFASPNADKEKILINYFKCILVFGKNVRLKQNSSIVKFNKILSEAMKSEDAVIKKICQLKRDAHRSIELKIDKHNHFYENFIKRLEKMNLNKKVILSEESANIQLVYDSNGI